MFIHPLMNRSFISCVSGKACSAFFCQNMSVCKSLFTCSSLCHYTAVIKDFPDKCSWILTSVFKSVIPVSPFSIWCNTGALKRLNRSKQEPDTQPTILCQCCYDIVWMLVETNHLGLIEKLINRRA